MKVFIDQNLCTGHGRCYTLSPELFESDQEGFVVSRGTTVDVAVESEAAARRAANACPEDAIILIDDTSDTVRGAS